ncbi:SSI family serine proteinase inhibitor [Nocardia sp. NBC_01009]|uniref:SSI family serine proteinase inhibitor n=1 Tax=Nocardia sp. NBC_01009 TaxID=2975996 RepID=UPI00386DE4DC|nr:subtilase-type protease inhibitor [Nocardia sp. NBC_01009]
MTTRSRCRIITIACVAIAASATSGACATAEPEQSKSMLDLVVSSGERPNPDGQPITLTCEPAGGTHEHPEVACAALDRVNGSFDDLAADSTAACIQIYDPVTVTATGTWRGVPVQWQRTFANSCELHSGTAGVF